MSVDTTALVTIALATTAPVAYVDALVPERLHLPHPGHQSAGRGSAVLRGGARLHSA